MTKPTVIYHIISGSGAVRLVPELVAALGQLKLPIYTLLTENAERVISPLEVAKLPGQKFIDSYFEPAMLLERAVGLTLVAPATFNTVNKLALGIGDTLAHSLVAEAIGAGWPVVVVPGVNPGLANHPQFKQSLRTLRAWGVTVLEPVPAAQGLIIPPVAEIVAAAASRLV